MRPALLRRARRNPSPACPRAAAALLLTAGVGLRPAQGRSQGLAIVDEIRDLGSIEWETGDPGEFGMLYNVPVTGTLVTTRGKYATQPAIFPSILTWTAMPHAARLRSIARNPDGTWTFELFFGQPWCHSAQPMPYTLNVQWFAFEPGYYQPAAGAGALLEVNVLKAVGGEFKTVPQAAAVANMDVNGGDVSVLAQVQSYDPSQAPAKLKITNGCTGSCARGSAHPSCASCRNNGPNPVCLACDASRAADEYNGYDWMTVRAGGSSATEISFYLECARQVNGNGKCVSITEDVAYAVFRKGLVEHYSRMTGEGYYVWAGVISGVQTALPGLRVDYRADFPIAFPLAGASVFGVQDAINGPDPSQPRLGEVYPDHLNVMVLEDNCHGSGDIGHANAVLSLVVVVWNATTATLPVFSWTKTRTRTLTPPPTPSPTPSETPTRTWGTPSLTPTVTVSRLSVTRTPSGTPTLTPPIPTETPSPSLSLTLSPSLSLTVTPPALCEVIWSTLCSEGQGTLLHWLLLFALAPICIAAAAALLWPRRVAPLELPSWPQHTPAVCDGGDITVHARTVPVAEAPPPPEDCTINVSPVAQEAEVVVGVAPVGDGGQIDVHVRRAAPTPAS